MRTVFWLILTAIVAFTVGKFIGRGQHSQTGPPVVIHDSVPVIRVDTVVRFLERINWKEVAPETVIVYRERVKVDTIYGIPPETMLSLWKRGSLLKVQAIRSGEVREYTYRLSPFSREWSIMSKGRGFFRARKAYMDEREEIAHRGCLGKGDTSGNITGTRHTANWVKGLFDTV